MIIPYIYTVYFEQVHSLHCIDIFCFKLGNGIGTEYRLTLIIKETILTKMQFESSRDLQMNQTLQNNILSAEMRICI
jgi:hypothetical protein